MSLIIAVVLVLVALFGLLYLLTRDKARDERIRNLTAENKTMRTVIQTIYGRAQLNSDNDTLALDIMDELRDKEELWMKPGASSG